MISVKICLLILLCLQLSFNSVGAAVYVDCHECDTPISGECKTPKVFNVRIRRCQGVCYSAFYAYDRIEYIKRGCTSKKDVNCNIPKRAILETLHSINLDSEEPSLSSFRCEICKDHACSLGNNLGVTKIISFKYIIFCLLLAHALVTCSS